MAISLLVREVSDLCLGKPALRSLSISAPVNDVLLMLKGSSDNFLSVWSCNHSSNAKVGFKDCRCVVNLCMVGDASWPLDIGKLIGEISPYTLASCDETVAVEITTLSVGNLMAYIDYGGPPEALVQVVKARLKERKLEGMLEEFSLSSCSSDKESSSSSPRAPLRLRRYSRQGSYSARMVGRAEASLCTSTSSMK
ncbi:PREDICTED: CBS domain-containing protein CBSX5-like [Nelumbo nucifera]|uniref:CBS domain-containing protein CBSX5-like n=1 Tax=Nelumbo nucifera TaxID=4432 RepID=A0A1U7YX17_NELNU|nr:PREDICTED: CBS domain-containing protein CBSX5-like [Nelumbo nucifera]